MLLRTVKKQAFSVSNDSSASIFRRLYDHIRYQLKTPYRDGTTHVIFEPLDFIARLAALVPKPRVNLTRFHGWRVCAERPTPCDHHTREAGQGQQSQGIGLG
jgi:hypothetical protein